MPYLLIEECVFILFLQELYLAYNDISDLSQVSMLDHLVILDLEGNNIEDIIQVQYLGLCSKLSVLTLEGNPVCLTPRPGATEDLGYNYRATVKDLIPQLSVLDDLPADDITPSACRQANEDWKTIKDLIKDSSLLEDDVTSATARPSTGQRPWISQRPASAGLFGTSRGYNIPGNLCPGSSGSDESVLEEDASGLTHGVGQVICGNPIKALRARRQKRLEAIQKEREPQILKITHCNDDECSLDGSSEEEFKESSYNDEVLSASPEPSGCTTPSPGKYTQKKWDSLVSAAASHCLMGNSAHNVVESTIYCSFQLTHLMYSGDLFCRAVLDRSSENLTRDHRPIIRSSTKSPESPSTQIGISPLRAKAAVQRLPNRPALRPPHSKTEII
uniref:Leucine-rich repeat-containing protein 56 n=1 Tax=Erpetoichthys calabaricus TaxID=27687 RepID=A0A8C4X3J5_ERPCA